ncbi:MAG: hypothetical protein ACXVYB_00075 [Arthrobacter sp.]
MNWDTGMYLLAQMKKLQGDTIRQAAKAFSESEPARLLTPEQVIAWLNAYADEIGGEVE